MIKYGYSSFKVDIIEYCDFTVIIKREQHYLDNLKLEYNTIKLARSLAGFKHSVATLERMRLAKMDRSRS